jgi:DNA-directed RNA polymerase subunit RPC12/RpoP
MSLIICPECAHEVSTSAVACTNCGHPFVKPVVQRNVVVSEVAPPRDNFPKWIFIPLGLLGITLLFVLLAYMRNDDEDARNINVRIASQPASNSANTSLRTDSAPNQIVVPPSQTGQVVVPPSSSSVPVAPPSSITTVAPPTETALPPDKGTVNLEAKVATRTGATQPVRAERFYLLSKDLESILSDADIDDETGQGLSNAFGLSVVYPNRYGDVNKKALAAIARHTVYKTQTDASGKAQLKGVKPDNYYLFGITKTGSGFAIWSSPVTIQAGDNSLVLPAAQMTETSQE